MANLLKFALPALLAVAGALAEPIQLFVAAHPAVSLVMGAVVSLATLFMKPPAKP